MGVLTDARSLAAQIHAAVDKTAADEAAHRFTPRTGAAAVHVKAQLDDHAERTNLSRWMNLARLTDPAGGGMRDWHIGFDLDSPVIGPQARTLIALEKARLRLPLVDAIATDTLMRRTAPPRPILEPLGPPPHRADTVAVHGTTSAAIFVVHCTEDNLTPEQLYAFFRSTPDGLGTQYSISPTGVLTIAAGPRQMTYHVVGLNSMCVGCELTGFDGTDWQSRTDQLLMLRWLIAWDSKNRGRPLVAAGREGVRVLTRPLGVSEHRWLPFNDHSDPGPHFPLAAELRAAAAWRDQGIPVAVAKHLRAVNAAA